jgi:protein-tyrosine phosphatase
MTTVLFICKGNVFRSMTAEYALRRELGDHVEIRIGSAGTADYPYTVMPEVRDYLLRRGLDVSGHARRTLTRPLLDEADLAVAMDPAPQAEIQARFGVTLPLFLSLCEPPGGGTWALPDLEEAVPDYRENQAAALRHLHAIIDRIIGAVPGLAERFRAA